MKVKEKHTRVFYNDPARLAMYEAMPPEQFKELFMAMLSYKGEDMDIKDPMVKALFAKEKVEIDRNEAEYERIRKIRQENGKKGGEAKKRANAVPEQRNEIVIEDSEKKEKKKLPEVERWAIAVINDTDGRGQEYFKKYWRKYFDSEDQADIYLSNYETKVI